MNWWPWLGRQLPAVTMASTGHAWCCSSCGSLSVVMVDGTTLYCMDHYEAEMQRRRASREASEVRA